MIVGEVVKKLTRRHPALPHSKPHAMIENHDDVLARTRLFAGTASSSSRASFLALVSGIWFSIVRGRELYTQICLSLGHQTS